MKIYLRTSIMTLVLAMLALCSYAQDTKEYVDLSLPSGTLWATCNVGASSPEQTGNYYAWGEITPKDTYTEANYRFGATGSYTKYCTLSEKGTVDGKTTLDAADDAATANWGSEWCMPTAAQLQELITKCTYASVTENGVVCGKFIGPNGNYILLPKAGVKTASGLDNNEQLFYNSRDIETEEGRIDDYAVGIASTIAYMNNNVRRNGVPVRAVIIHKSAPTPADPTLTIGAGDDLSAIKASLGDAASNITELYITGNYTTAASINALKTNYFPNLAKVHLTLQTSATSIAASAYKDCTLMTEITVPNTITSIGSAAFGYCI